MDKQEKNEFLAENLFGEKRGVDFGTWDKHDWQRESDDYYVLKLENETDEAFEARKKKIAEAHEIERESLPIDYFAYNSGNCNGPACRRCSHSFCVYCTKDHEADINKPCTIDVTDYTKNFNLVLDAMIKLDTDVLISYCDEFKYEVTFAGYSITGSDSGDTLGEAICNSAVDYFQDKIKKGVIAD